jgi:hypothetical protein
LSAILERSKGAAPSVAALAAASYKQAAKRRAIAVILPWKTEQAA